MIARKNNVNIVIYKTYPFHTLTPNKKRMERMALHDLHETMPVSFILVSLVGFVGVVIVW